MPRDGTSNQTVWLPRPELERRLGQVLSFPGVHVCIDGSTGTGKSSLALTVLSQLRFPFAMVQITKGLTWPGLLRQVSASEDDDEMSSSAELNLGFDKGLPTGQIKLGIGKKSKGSGNLDFEAKRTNTWSEHDVASLMAQEDCALFIDDFENADEDLVVKISGLCKLLTQSYSSKHAKIVVVGTGDTFARLYEANPSLEARLHEESIGTFPHKNDSWKFMQLGFEALRLKHPANDSRVKPEDNIRCRDAIYEAADGLPKSLVELGRTIALKAEGRSRVSPHDIQSCAHEIPLQNLRIFRRQFREIVKCVESNPITRDLLRCLYQLGINQVHQWYEIEAALKGSIPKDQLDTAISDLVSVGFLVRTGRSGEIFFAQNPNLAHVLGVVVTNPDKYDLPRELYGSNGQLQLSLVREIDEDLTA